MFVSIIMLYKLSLFKMPTLFEMFVKWKRKWKRKWKELDLFLCVQFVNKTFVVNKICYFIEFELSAPPLVFLQFVDYQFIVILCII